MPHIFDILKDKVTGNLRKDALSLPSAPVLDYHIALGVLLWSVAAADNKFLPEEERNIRIILTERCGIARENIEGVLESIKAAEAARIDIYQFTNEITQNFSYEQRVGILEALFRVACADNDLDDTELELIRTIAGLFHVSHKDFIEAKIRVKKEFGMDTAGL